jgi:hypothetical protein
MPYGVSKRRQFMGNDRATCGIARENVVDAVKSSKRRSNGLKKAFERTIGILRSFSQSGLVSHGYIAYMSLGTASAPKVHVGAC